MKHTLKGLHGHVFRVSYDKNSVRTEETVCITPSEAAYTDFISEEYVVREKLSVKWKVCMDCWKPNPPHKIRDLKGKVIAYNCGFGKCPAWGKPKRVKSTDPKGPKLTIEKMKRLKKKGWRFGNAEDFLSS